MKLHSSLLLAVLAACRTSAPSVEPNPEPGPPVTRADPQPTESPQPSAAVDPEHPQTPVPPFPYLVEEVTYTNPTSGLTLAGTLTIPEAAGPHPAVLLISGSGAQDRDSTLLGHRPFAVIADDLTRRDIAVLRVDDRGVGGSERGPAGVTSEDFATDVEAGVAYLRTRAEIDPGRVALVGHSEGGMIAPMVAAKDPKLAGIVLLAGPGVPGKQLLVSQARALLQAKGMPEGMVEAAVEQQEQTMTAVDEAETVEQAREGVLDVVGDNEMTRKAVEAQIIPWTLYFVKHDPAPTLERVQCPVLALGGTLDTQVVASENLPAIESALRKGGNEDVTIQTLEGLNHLFQPAQTGDPDEYQGSKVTFDEASLELIGDWLSARLLEG
ncbi:MAG: alpha/beta fold hydrolase [Nannocystaceae bacterium]|nr:alpha/beta fold hydrolase [bacterium]